MSEREKNCLKEMQKVTPLEDLLGAERVETVRDRIAELIVARVAQDIEDFDYFLFYPEDYRSDIADAYQAVKSKIQKMYKDAMLEAATKAVERFKQETEALVGCKHEERTDNS